MSVMEVAATYKEAPMSAQKVRLVVDQIRGLHVQEALKVLTFSKKKAADIVKKVLNSAIANAENNNGSDVDELIVSTAFVDQAPVLKRFRARARGRGSRILKRNCHITVAVKEIEEK